MVDIKVERWASLDCIEPYNLCMLIFGNIEKNTLIIDCYKKWFFWGFLKWNKICEKMEDNGRNDTSLRLHKLILYNFKSFYGE